MRDVNVYPDNPMGSGAEGAKYRFQWNFPLLFSPHKTNGKYALYAAANILFRSFDEGQSWEAISPDLTRNDKTKQVSQGGPLSKDNTSVEYYDTIFTVAESPVTQGVIWAGTDDGLVQITRDGGKNWENVTPKGMPEWIQINSIEASPFDAGTAYFAATAYKLDNYQPYIYKTSDYGKTWKKIVAGIANDALYARGPRRPESARFSLRRNGNGNVLFDERRRKLAVFAAEFANRPDHRSGDSQARKRFGRRHAGTFVLCFGQSAAALQIGGRAEIGSVFVSTRRRVSHAWIRRFSSSRERDIRRKSAKRRGRSIII